MAIDQVISLSANGGDATAAEINKTSQALNGVTDVSKGMEEAFSHRFEHIGLRIFAGDLLRTSGLSAEMRPILSTLMLGINAVGSTFGAAAGPVMLVVAALSAVIGVIQQVEAHSGTSVDALEKQVAALDKDRQAHQSNIAQLTAYGAALGSLPPLYQKWLDSETKLRDEGLKEEEQAIRSEIAAIQAHIAAMQATFPVTEVMKTTMKALFDTFTGMVNPITKVSVAMSGSLAPNTKKAADEMLKAQNTINELMVKLDQLEKQGGKTFQEMTSQAQEFTSAMNNEAEFRWKAEQHYGDMFKQYNADLYKEIADDEHQRTKTHDDELKKMQATEKQVSTQIGTDVGNAFAKMIVEGQSFTQAMQQAFTRMAEQIISDLVRIIVEQEILLGLEEMTGTQGAASAGGGFFGGAFASGGSAVVSQPTMFLAGEAGPEIASFTPMGQSGSSSGSGGSGVGTVNLTLMVDHIEGNDPASTLDMLSNEIRRETNSGRVFAATVSGVASRYPKQAF